jgi:hypothetical protein
MKWNMIIANEAGVFTSKINFDKVDNPRSYINTGGNRNLYLLYLYYELIIRSIGNLKM